jgi:hypothetical protein
VAKLGPNCWRDNGLGVKIMKVRMVFAGQLGQLLRPKQQFVSRLGGRQPRLALRKLHHLSYICPLWFPLLSHAWIKMRKRAHMVEQMDVQPHQTMVLIFQNKNLCRVLNTTFSHFFRIITCL